MAYFSNGTEGDMYEEKYCSRCIHNDTDPNDALSFNSCPILELHMTYNYDQQGTGKTAKIIKHVLNTLIPRKKESPGFADECSMFVQDTRSKDDRYIKHLQAGEPPIDYLTKI